MAGDDSAESSGHQVSRGTVSNFLEHEIETNLSPYRELWGRKVLAGDWLIQDLSIADEDFTAGQSDTSVLVLKGWFFGVRSWAL